MVTTEARHDVRLKSGELLAQLMQHNGYTVRSLAEDATRRLRKDKLSTKCGRGTVGNLRSGYRTACNEDVARAIAQCLNLPVSALFDSKVSNVQREVQRPLAA